MATVQATRVQQALGNKSSTHPPAMFLAPVSHQRPKLAAASASSNTSSCVTSPAAWQPRVARRSVAAQYSTNPQLNSLEEATVEEIMLPRPVTCRPNHTCKEAARLLLDNDLSSVPVVDEAGHLVGVLSESDLLWKGAGAPLDHTIIPPVFVGAFDLLISLRDSNQIKNEIDKIVAREVSQAMTRNPVTIKPTELLSRAAHVMLANKVHSLPVVENGKLVGVVTQHDILRGMVAEQLPLL